MLLNHARGDLLHHLGRHRHAFDAFSRANQLRGLHFDGDAHRAATRALAESFPDNAFDAHSSIVSDRPVLIVGMPRSGTSLVEQILSMHPDVDARGELEALRDVAIDIGGYPLRDLGLEDLDNAARSYLSALGGDGERATDKIRARFGKD